MLSVRHVEIYTRYFKNSSKNMQILIIGLTVGGLSHNVLFCFLCFFDFLAFHWWIWALTVDKHRDIQCWGFSGQEDFTSTTWYDENGLTTSKNKSCHIIYDARVVSGIRESGSCGNFCELCFLRLLRGPCLHREPPSLGCDCHETQVHYNTHSSTSILHISRHHQKSSLHKNSTVSTVSGH